MTSNEYGDHEMRRSRTEDFPPPPMSLYEEDSATESRRDSKTENDILMAQIRDKINVENARRTSPTRDWDFPYGRCGSSAYDGRDRNETSIRSMMRMESQRLQ